MLTLILLIGGFVCVVLAAFNVPSTKVSLGWLGVVCLMLAYLLTRPWP